MSERHSPDFLIPPRKILVRGVNWLGDAVMTMPALQRLREAKPDAHIALLTPEKLAGLWENHSAINSVLTFKSGENPWRIGRKLRAEKFDLAIALPDSHRSAIELWWAKIPERVGYGRPFRNLFLTKPIRPRAGAIEMRKRSLAEINRLNANPNCSARSDFPPRSHHIFQYLHLVTALGANPEPLAPSLSVTKSELASFQKRLGEISGFENRLWLGLNPGAEYGPAKRWPADRFIAAAITLHEQTNCSWIIFGARDPGTKQVTEELERKLGRKCVVNLAGQTTLRELCAGLKFCKLVLTNDTGPMHVAAALGTPVVVPFGSTSAELTGPGLPGNGRHVFLKSSVPCAPCFLRECPIDFRCMKSISVEAVSAACRDILKNL